MVPGPAKDQAEKIWLGWPGTKSVTTAATPPGGGSATAQRDECSRVQQDCSSGSTSLASLMASAKGHTGSRRRPSRWLLAWGGPAQGPHRLGLPGKRGGVGVREGDRFLEGGFKGTDSVPSERKQPHAGGGMRSPALKKNAQNEQKHTKKKRTKMWGLWIFLGKNQQKCKK